ncbi:MAG: Dickkopf N-terminal cysteine-rich domain-containing protein [Deltaproteobacteria bacterium]
MVRKLFVAAMVVVAVGLARVVPFAPSGEAQAAAECQKDADCKDGTFCIVALSPHVCKPPQEKGASCKRDVVCASKKCDLPAGKDVGTCK